MIAKAQHSSGGWKGLGIAQRLWLGFGVVCALLALVVGITGMRVAEISESTRRMTEVRVPAADTGAQLENRVYASLAHLRAFLLTHDAKFKEERAATWREAEGMIAQMDDLSGKFTNPDNKRLWGEARLLLGELRAAQDRVEAQDGDQQAAVRILVAEVAPRADKIIDLLEGARDASGQRRDGLVQRQKAMLFTEAASVEAAVDGLRVTVWSLLAIGLAAGGAAAFVCARGITRPLAAMTGAMKLLATGDTAVAVPARERRDEIGEMAQAVQVFKDNAIEMRRLEAEQQEQKRRAEAERRAALLALADGFEASVKGVVDGVASASTEMQATAQSMSAVAEQANAQAGTVAAASEEASTNVQTVAAAAEELSSSISEISRQVSHSADISASAVAEAARANEMVAGLAAAAGKISEVVSLITTIASQTNLLALNATIEAARAGDAGKGFAVVANEVKSLANQTARATDEIVAQIAAVQARTDDAVDAIRGIGDTITSISQIAAAIASAVEEQGAATQEIARNVQQAAHGTEEVSSAIGGVTRAAGEAGSAAQQVLTASSDLSRQAEKLRGEVDHFIARVRAG